MKEQMSRPTHRTSLNLADLVAGVGVILFCGAFALFAYRYGLGSVARMGAGFFPFWFAVAGAILGVAICAGAVVRPAETRASIHWRSLLFVSAAFVAFGLLIEPAGLIVAIVASTILGAMADRGARVVESLVLGLGLAAGIWVIFVLLLGLSIPVLPGGR